MPEVHIPLEPGETMGDLRRRARSFCEANRIPFEQAGQIPQALALFVADCATSDLLQQALAPATSTPPKVGSEAIRQAAAPEQPGVSTSRERPPRGTLRSAS
jgi:hypothetical protein